MGFLDFILDSKKESDVDDAPPGVEPIEDAEPIESFEPVGGYVMLPHLVHQCMTMDAVEVKCTQYFQDVISELPFFRLIDFKILKATKKNTPPDWNIEEGDVSVITEDGEFVGILDAGRFVKLGRRTGRCQGFVEPPSRDPDIGFKIASKYRVYIFRSFTKIRENSIGIY